MISGCIDFSKDTCKENVSIIGSACENYAKEHKGKYPQNLDVLIKKGYIKKSEIIKCPKDNCEYKFISKYIKKYGINYYIIRCQNHSIISDSQVGLLDLKLLCITDNEMGKEYFVSVAEGKVSDRITLTDEELKKLGFKKSKKGDEKK